MKSVSIAALIVALGLGISAPVDLGPPPASTMPTLTPQYFTTAGHISPEQLQAQPQEPTALFGGGGYLGKMALCLDTPNRMRIPAGTKYPIIGGPGNLDTFLGPGQNWFRRGIGYLIGDRDANGTLLTAADYAAGKGVVSTVATDLSKYSRTVATGTFSSCGFGFLLDNTNPTPDDRYAWFTMISEPQNGFARRTDLICICFEGSSSIGTIGATGVPFRANDVFVDAALYDASKGVTDAGLVGAGSNFSTGAGTQSSPYTNILYAVAMAAQKMGASGYSTDFTPKGPVATVWVDTSSTPALLDFSAYGYKCYGYDHVVVRPWPGKCVRGETRRSAPCHVDRKAGTPVYSDRVVSLPYNRVIFQDFRIDMSNISAFSMYGVFPNFSVGASIGFINPLFTLDDFEGDNYWLGEGKDGIIDSGLVKADFLVGLKPVKEFYSAFIINGAGRLGSMAGMTLINGGHFDISWDAFYLDNAFSSWAFFDSVARQTADCVNPNHGIYPLPVDDVFPDPVGQRTVIRIADEIWPGVARYSIKNNVVSVYCYAADGKTPKMAPFPSGWGNAPTIKFPANDPVLGGMVLTLTGIDNTRSWVFQANPPAGVTLSDTVSNQGPLGFTYASMGANTLFGLVTHEGRFASIASGAAKTNMRDTDGMISGNVGTGEPDFNTPDFVATYATPTACLSVLATSIDRAVPALASRAIMRPLKYGTPYQPKGTLSGNVITFKGTVVSFDASVGLTTKTDARGKLATFSGPINPSLALIWGMSVRANGRTLGRIAQAGVNLTSTPIYDTTATKLNDGSYPVLLPARSFYLEDTDGGPDLTGVAWEASYDLHGLTIGHDLSAINDDTGRYPITGINGNVVTVGNNASGFAPSPTSNVIATWQEELGQASNQIVVIERSWDYFGAPKDRQTKGLKKRDGIRNAAGVQHNDRFQISINWYPTQRAENNIWQHARWNGFNLQMEQQQAQGQYPGIGTMITHVAGDGYGQNDGCDVNWLLPTVAVTEPASPTAADFWIDGTKYPSYTLTSDLTKAKNADGTFSQCVSNTDKTVTPNVTTLCYRQIAADGITATGWSDESGKAIAAPTGTLANVKHPLNAAITPVMWVDPRRHMRVRFLSKYNAATFRVARIVATATAMTLVILDDKAALTGAALGVGDTFQQPLFLDNNSLISVAKGGSVYSRVFTPNLDNPGTGRVDKPFYGAGYAGANIPGINDPAFSSLSAAAKLTTIAWYLPLQIVDVIAVSSAFGSGLKGQRYTAYAPGGGIEKGVGWNNVGNVQSTQGMSAAIPARIGFNGASMDSALIPKGGTINRYGQIDSVSGGVNPGTGIGLAKSDALWSNSYFGKMGVVATLGSLNPPAGTPANDRIDDAAMTAMGSGWEFPVVSTVDPETFRPLRTTTFGGRKMRQGLGPPRWPWAADCSELPTDGTAVIGAMQPLAV